MNTDTHTSGSTVKNHISLITVFGYSAIRRTSFRSWFLVYQRVLPQACLLHHPSHRESVDGQERGDPCGIDPCPAAVSSEHVERQERGDPCSSEISAEQLLTKPTKNPQPNENVNHDQERGDPLHSDVPEWLQEFRENLVDDRVPEHRDSHASSSHESSLEPTPARSADLGKHSVYTTSRKTEIARSARGPKLQGRRAEDALVESYLVQKFQVICLQQITKFSVKGCKSRNNHRYAVVVQDLATQWIQWYPCKTKTSQETQRSFLKFLEPNRKPKVIYTDNSLDFGKACEDLSWNHCIHHTDRRLMVLLKEQCAE